MIEDTLVALVDRFNRHVEHNPGTKEELMGVHRIIQLYLGKGEAFTLELKDGRMAPPRTGNGGSADVKITCDPATFEGLVRKEIGPMRALYSGKLKIEASLEDKLLLRRLL